MEELRYPSVSVEREEGEWEDDDNSEPGAKMPKIHWQEALVSVLATQQEQLIRLSNQFNMAAGPTPNPSPSTSSSTSAQALTTSTAAFQLAEYDPDNTSYAIEEWLDVAAKLKEELHVGDVLMIAKAGEALKGRAHHYYCNWRPINRTWVEFNKDLIVAFPDRETPGARAYYAATLRSRDCESLSDYGITKLRCIKRFYSELPWHIILSMVEYGLDHNETQAAIRIQQPQDERELVKLLSEFDARRRLNRASNSEMKTANFTKSSDKQKYVSVSPSKRGCFKCGKLGHQSADCQTPNKPINSNVNTNNEPTENPLICQFCKRFGHREDKCWHKHGKHL